MSDLWNINENLPQEMATKILKTMPFMYKIAGNLPLLTRILETIIEEDIKVHKEFSSIAENNTETMPWQLGVNLATTAEKAKTFLPKYIFTVNNIKFPEKIENYLPGGSITAVIRFFLKHTLPFEFDYEINFTLPKQKQKFTMNNENYSARLGVSATI